MRFGRKLPTIFASTSQRLERDLFQKEQRASEVSQKVYI